MPAIIFEIRLCAACGLRFPLRTSERLSNPRCPVCMGETRVILSRGLSPEPLHGSLPTDTRKYIFSVLLDNIRSAQNVGSIIRTADGFGYEHAYICGITPTPDNDLVRKTSLGAEISISWTYHKNAVHLAKEIKSKATRIIALEENDISIPLENGLKHRPSTSNVLVLGNEITGVDPDLLEISDEIYHIPMHGQKKSFNVATAFGIAAFALQQFRN